MTLLDDLKPFTDAKTICDLVNIIVSSDDDYEEEYFEVDKRLGHIISIDRIIMIAPKSEFDPNELECAKGGGKWSLSILMLKKVIGLIGDYDSKLFFPEIAAPIKIQCNHYDIYIAPRVEEAEKQ